MTSILTLLIFPLMGIFFLVSLWLLKNNLIFFNTFFSRFKITKLLKEYFYKSTFYSRIFIFSKINQNNLLKGITFYCTVINFFFSLVFLFFFNSSFYGNQFTFKWVFFNIGFRFGIDGISLCFILLTTALIPICLLISWDYIHQNIFLYLIAFLFLEIFLILFFSTLNILFFYISFESILIPMFFIIGMWGGPRKIKANYYFFLYTLTGSIFMLIGLLIIWDQAGTLDFLSLSEYKFNDYFETLLWFLFAISFAVKIPIFPFHLWLPEAHVEAPTAGSVILAGLLLKLGGYGFIRICLTFFPVANANYNFYLAVFCTFSVIFASISSMSQIDLKKLVAYSSIAHMNFGLIGIFTGGKPSLDGSIVSMLSHGFVSAALFICVDIVYRRFGSRNLDYFGGLVYTMPKFSFFLCYFCMANLGFPGTSSFPGEVLIFANLVGWNPFLSALSGLTVVLSAVYSLYLFVKISFGNHKPLAYLNNISNDLNNTEFGILFILAIFSFILGVYPTCVFEIIDQSTNFIFENRKC